MQKASTAVAASLAICMLLAGCGGSDPELSKAEFVKQADAICVAVKKRLSKELENDANDLYVSTAEALQTEADEIGALGAPGADSDQIDAIVESARRVATTIEEGGLEESEERELDKKDLDQATSQMSKAERLARSYGLESCPLT
jgi:reverse gyrase